MIVYLATTAHRYTPLIFLETVGHALNDRFRILDYDGAFRMQALAPATYIFADLERLDADTMARARDLWTALSRDGRSRLLNDPARALRRFDLLHALRGAQLPITSKVHAIGRRKETIACTMLSDVYSLF